MAKLLYLLMVFLNSSFKKGGHSILGFIEISFNKYVFIWQSCTELNVWWSACHRSSSLIQEYSLYYRAFIAGKLHFMRSQGLLFSDAISWIFSSRNICLVFLIILLKFFQSSIVLEDQYLFILTIHFLFHYTLEHLVILTFLENLYQIESEILICSWTISSRDSLLDISVVLIFLIAFVSSVTNFSSSSLFLIIVCYLS